MAAVHSLFAAGLIAIGLLAVQGCSTSSTSPGTTSSTSPTSIGNTVLVRDLPPPAKSASGATDLIAQNDVIQVDVFGVDTLDRTVQVDSQGKIALPLIGDVAAAGKSQRELEKTIAAAYGKSYLQNPAVTVFVKESYGQRVTVDGEVNKAGIYPTTSSSTLLQVIAQAGGFNTIANGSQVLVFRQISGKNLVASYDVDAIRKGKGRDTQIYGGDIVVVPNSSAKMARNNLKDILGMAGNVGSLAVLGL